MIALHDLLVGKIDIWTAARALGSSGAGRRSKNSESLYGVERLRSLILELAMTGRLVNCGSSKNLLINYLIGENKAVGDPLRDEGLTALPQGWGWIRFSDILDFQGGSQPPKDKFSDEKLDGYIQLLQIRDLGDHPQPVYIKKELTTKFCTPSDIMIGRYGASVGKIFWGKEGAYNVALVKVIDEFGIFDKNFLYQLFKSPVGQSLFAGISRSAQAGFNKGDIENKLIPVCTIEEQLKVIDKVNELMLICDELEEREIKSSNLHDRLVKNFLSTLLKSINTSEFKNISERTLKVFDSLFITEDSIDQLKSAFLQIAMQGGLSQPMPSDQSAKELFELINYERTSPGYPATSLKRKNISPLDLKSLPIIPAHWLWTQNEYISHDWGQKVPAQPFLYIDVSSIDSDKGIVATPNVVLPEDAPSRARKIVKPGSVIYSTVRPYLLNVAIIDEKFDIEPIVSTAFVVIYPRASISPKFIFYYLRSPIFINYVESVQTGTTYPAINDMQFYSAPFPLPPLAEQNRIVELLDKLIELCDEMKSRISESNELQRKMADAVVAKFQ